MSAIKNVYELLSFDGKRLITACYLTFLEREPDEHGMRYYMGRLASGASKEQIIYQLSASAQNFDVTSIMGLNKLVKKQKRLALIGRIIPRKKSQAYQFYLEQIGCGINELDKNINIILEEIISIKLNLAQDIDMRVNEVQKIELIKVERQLEQYNNLVKKIYNMTDLSEINNSDQTQSFLDKLKKLPKECDIFNAYFENVEL